MEAQAAMMNLTRSITRRRAIELIGATGLLPAALPGANAADPRTILFFTKSSGFEHDMVHRTGEDLSPAEKILTRIGEKQGITVIATKDGRVFDDDVDRYDAFAFFTTGDLTEAGTDRAPPMSGQGKQALLAAIRNGKGFVGIHSASDTFHSPGNRFATQREPDPYIAMLGGEFFAHGSQQPAQVSVSDPTFAGLEGLRGGFTTTEEWYSLKNFASDIHVLLVLETGAMTEPEYRRPRFPLAWARREGKGRVYYNAMGHREDVWTSARFQQMLGGALAWATDMTDVTLVRNMSAVTPQAGVLPPQE
jgi:type 1 glutamine amidotransferase